MEFDIHRYLIANSHGVCDGAAKAHHHLNLCRMYVASKKLCRTDEVDDVSDYFESIHSSTQRLTDNMDTLIEFPIDSKPDYDELAPKFFEQFIILADMC